MHQDKSAKFGNLPMMTVVTLGTLNVESFCECVLSCVKLVVSDLQVCLKSEEIPMFVILRMNLEFMEYMRTSYPDTPLFEFKTVDTYVCTHGGVETLEDDEDDDKSFCWFSQSSFTKCHEFHFISPHFTVTREE
jgi:hypothetical protein